MKTRFAERLAFIKTSQLYLALKDSQRLVGWVSLSMLAQSLVTLAMPWPIRTIIDQVIEQAGDDMHMTEKNDLWQFILSSFYQFFQSDHFDFLYLGIGLLMVLYLTNSLLLYTQAISLAKLGQQVVFHIRENLFAQVIALPHNFIEESPTGDLTSRISKDTADVQDILESLLTVFVRSLPTVVGILIVSFALDWIFALTFVFVIPLVYWSNVVFTRRTKEAIRSQRRVEGDMASSVQEALHQHKAVATMSLESDIVADFLENSRESVAYGLTAGRMQGKLTASIDFLVGAASLMVLFVGVLRIMHGCLTVGQLMVFLTYLNSLFKPIREISKFAGRLAKSTAALERVDELARMNPSTIGAAEAFDAVAAPPFQGRIELEAVTFGYHAERDILENLNLLILPGRKIAFVGESGSGKSTILQLLMRLYDPRRGTIRIDGRDIRSLTLASLRHQMAIVLQDSFIFRTTIAENIAIAKPDATESQVIAAAQAAEADEFIRDMPLGYQTLLGEGGAGLSGGQKRRLAIARAFLRNVPIVLLDEPTVGLDAASEQKVIAAVDRLTKGKTTLIVTHQLATITDADLIVVLVGGKIVESGNYQELMNKNGVFSELWERQMGDVLK